MKKVLLISALVVTAALHAQSNRTAEIGFHNFSWGTSIEIFTARVGNPVHSEEANGFQSLVYENIPMAGYRAFMVAYFSSNGLEGGTYYFNTGNLDESRQCYTAVQSELVAMFGPTPPAPAGRYETLLREMRTYVTCWDLPDGYINLTVNTRSGDPVTLWFASPTMTKMLDGS